MTYNYIEAMTADITEYIKNEIDTTEYTDRDELEQALNDDLWTVDSVTGNASGSYTFNYMTAREYVLDNTDTLKEALNEFGCDMNEVAEHFLNDDYEYFDVTIRCYLLGQAISEALDELEDELEFAPDED